MKDQNMHIMLISYEYPPETGWGGIGTYARTLAHGLAAIGMRVSVLAGAMTSDVVVGQDGPVRVVRVPAMPVRGLWRIGAATNYSMGRALAVCRTLRAVSRDDPPDIIEYPEYGAEGLFTRWAVPRTTGRVAQLHISRKIAAQANGAADSWDLNFATRLERLSVRFAHAVTSPSRSLVAESRRILGLRNRDVRVIPNPIDIEHFRPSVSGSTIARGDTILFVGRLEFRKGAHRLVPVIPRVLDHHPTARFVFIGKDTKTAPDGGSMRAFLEANLPTRCRDRVVFIGYIARENLPEHLAAASVCLVPSYNYDNFPYVVLEAMACGRPVVASPVGGIPEMIEDGVTGYLRDPDSPEEFSEGILSVLGDVRTATRIGEAARQHVVDAYRSERIAADKLDFFRVVCDKLRTANGAPPASGSPIAAARSVR